MPRSHTLNLVSVNRDAASKHPVQIARSRRYISSGNTMAKKASAIAEHTTEISHISDIPTRGRLSVEGTASIEHVAHVRRI